MTQVSSKLSGIVLASAAAAMFLAAPMAGADDTTGMKAGHSAGSNSCKGHSSCKGTSGADKKQGESKEAGSKTDAPASK